MKDIIRIGNAGGYWGDDPSALERQINGDIKLDYITMDFLAEITMSIMQKQKDKDSSLGYAKDFISMLKNVLPKLIKNKTRIITNAGGINPQDCGLAIRELAESLGLDPKIAIVYGDDILSSIEDLEKQNIAFKNMETGEDFATVKSRIKSANIYFGATAVVEALKWEPDIIITGRVTDTGITMAPMIHHFDWAENDWDKLAAGVVAGHIIECGTQSTGGNFTDWQKVDNFDKVGFPIIEMHKNGEFYVTKHSNTGGLVCVDTVREQLVYEMGNPNVYITPDVIALFSTIQLEQVSANRVKVSGIKGDEPTPFYKVSMAYEDGYKSVGSIMISGPNARVKAEAFANIFWKRIEGDIEEKATEYVGFNSCHRSLVGKDDGNEILLRLGARSKDKSVLKSFGKIIPALILSGPPGVAVIGGVPRPAVVMSYWPALMPKEAIKPRIARLADGKYVDEKIIENCPNGNFTEKLDSTIQETEKSSAPIKNILEQDSGNRLIDICLARSGDKGDTANIGVLARSPEAYEFLRDTLTAQWVKDHFSELCHGKVIRYEVDNLLGFNFLLEQSLGGGGTKTLRIDAQGKTFAQALLDQKMIIPESVLNSAK